MFPIILIHFITRIVVIGRQFHINDVATRTVDLVAGSSGTGVIHCARELPPQLSRFGLLLKIVFKLEATLARGHRHTL